MSVFQTIKVSCPACGQTVQVEAVYSVNGDRRPDLREAILERTFQRETCGACQGSFRLDPEFAYLHVGRGLWLAVFPLQRLGEWEVAEQEAREAFDQSFGPAAGAGAQEVGAQLRPRVVFGWAALREKLVIQQAELDDVTLELVKIAILRAQEGSPLSDGTELRLVGADDESLILAWLDSADETIVDALEVPRMIYHQVEQDRTAWQQVRTPLEEGLFVDMQRLMVAGEAAQS